MSQTNSPARRAATAKTYEGALAHSINPDQQLRRLVLAHMLWENQFYIDGKSAAEQVSAAIGRVKPETVLALAVEAREQFKLRHMPLYLVREIVRSKVQLKDRSLISETLARIIQRPDELSEFLGLYWADGRQSIANQVKVGLASAFCNFSPYQLAKYNRDAAIKLRDVLFLVHPKPIHKEQGNTWKRLIGGFCQECWLRIPNLKVLGSACACLHPIEASLPIPDTWEVAISAIPVVEKAARKAEWYRLGEEGKLGGLAFLRNLRNMRDDGVEAKLIINGMRNINFDRVLPFRFVAAARAVPEWEALIEVGMFRACENLERLNGKTAVVIDNSGSMYYDNISAKSDLTRSDAACALAILIRETCEDALIVSYSTKPSVVAPRRGFALRDAIKQACTPNSTNTQDAIMLAAGRGYDRLVVLTDEQSHQQISNPLIGTKAYIINVSAHKNGVGYGPFVHVDGFSEAVVSFIHEIERSEIGSRDS